MIPGGQQWLLILLHVKPPLTTSSLRLSACTNIGVEDGGGVGLREGIRNVMSLVSVFAVLAGVRAITVRN